MRRAVLASVVLLCFALLPPSAGRAADVTNSSVTNVNVTDQDFSVAWYTDQSVSASIAFGTACGNLNQQSTGSQAPSDGYVHLIDAGAGLDASTTYYYKLSENGTLYGDPNNNGGCFKVTTFPVSEQIGVPSTVLGHVAYASQGCSGTQPGLLVFLQVTRNGTFSQVRAAMTSDDGEWSIVVGDIRDNAGNLFNPQNGDTLKITAVGAPNDSATASPTYNPPADSPQDVGTTTLPQAPPGATCGTPATSTATPTGTALTPVATATATASGTTTVTTTASPTATSTMTPTGTITPVTATATGTITPSPTLPPGTTATPTSTSTAIPGASATATSTSAPSSPNGPSPTPMATHTQTPTSKPVRPRIQIAVKLFPQRFRRGTHAKLNIHTDSFADMRLIVSYPGGGARDWMTGTSSLTGFWQAKWVISTRHRGRATAQLRVVSGSQHRYYTIGFTVR
jgi:hypothetical protein